MCLTRAPASANHPTRHTFLMLLMKWFCNNSAFKVKIIEHIFMTSCPPGVSLSMDIVPPKNLQLISRGFPSQLNQQTANAEKSARLILHVACWTTKKKRAKIIVDKWVMTLRLKLNWRREKKRILPHRTVRRLFLHRAHTRLCQNGIYVHKSEIHGDRQRKHETI